MKKRKNRIRFFYQPLHAVTSTIFLIKKLIILFLFKLTILFALEAAAKSEQWYTDGEQRDITLVPSLWKTSIMPVPPTLRHKYQFFNCLSGDPSISDFYCCQTGSWSIGQWSLFSKYFIHVSRNKTTESLLKNAIPFDIILGPKRRKCCFSCNLTL